MHQWRCALTPTPSAPSWPTSTRPSKSLPAPPRRPWMAVNNSSPLRPARPPPRPVNWPTKPAEPCRGRPRSLIESASEMSLGPPQPKPQPQVQSQPQNQNPSQNQPPTGRAAVSVVGGTNGILANVEDLRIAARTFGAAARSSATDTLRLHGALFGQDLAGAAVLDPAGAARFE